ncbi:hypothetical protein GZ77_08010 [Endozoicomonas montiporae]|uniref:Uncharacterized protein n=2 Tax=Endozoicomonas montiporae TaxID=1027273 RepID=A0A081N7B2_9GAMM|nr:hypothetical protein [Endozoicomonas montiporae]AMO55834.1 hypothetical protein EZMO1_1685 [Endozoicomonas montiporae CL-33]KEQ14335.1 hypothetical protein GZ77_08010 [Endozoicomonas montiporae]
MTVVSERSQRRQQERERKKLIKRWQKKLDKHTNDTGEVTLESSSVGLPKLSVIINNFASPLYNDAASKEEIDAIFRLVIGYWNLGHFHDDDKAVLFPYVIEPLLAHFDDPENALRKKLEKVTEAKCSEYDHDPRFIVDFMISPLGNKSHLQVASLPIKPEDFKSAHLKNSRSKLKA